MHGRGALERARGQKRPDGMEWDGDVDGEMEWQVRFGRFGKASNAWLEGPPAVFPITEAAIHVVSGIG